MNEVWKNIKGYENLYQVSNMGKVRSLDRIVTDSLGKKRSHKGRDLYLAKLSKGYIGVRFYIQTKMICKKVHRLVAQAFILNPEKKPQVNHIDGVKANNHVNNLEWCTCRENVIHAIKIGLIKGNCGEVNGQSKLQRNDVLKIRKLYKNNKKSQNELSRMFNISQPQIERIVNYKSWKHI